MDLELRDRFVERWPRYFGGAELPITFFYTDEESRADLAPMPSDHECLLGSLGRVRHGQSMTFDAARVGCGGGKRYLGFTQELRPEFEHFLSCGIPGTLEGERYKRSPELVRAFIARAPRFVAPARYIVFKRWDALEARDTPEVAIFFARPDVLSGLFTLANFDAVEPNAVFAPFAAGCGSIVQYPYLERTAALPRAVLGMFDVSARPYVPGDVLTFAVPMTRLAAMIENMGESFLITHSWEKVRQRLA